MNTKKYFIKKFVKKIFYKATESYKYMLICAGFSNAAVTGDIERGTDYPPGEFFA